MTAGPLPLQGVRVLDLTRNVAGPMATLILADLGADVIKIESVTGDDARGWGPPFVGDDSLTFLALNRNKRSVVLDLREDSARRAMERLVSTSDVLVSSFRAGALDELGYGWEWASAINPALVYVSISAFGEAGPLKTEPGYDPLVQAFAGLMSVTGELGRPPVRVGVSIIDSSTGMWAAVATLAALYERRETGVGRFITTSLYESGLMWMGSHIANYSTTGELPERCGSGAVSIVPYQAFATADGYLVIAAGNDRLFARLAGVLGHDEWAKDPRFESNGLRVTNRDTLVALIQDEAGRRRTVDLASDLRAVGVPCSELQDVAQVTSDPQATALEMFQQFERLGATPRVVALPVSFDGVRLPLRTPPPFLGHDTDAVLAELGLDDA